MHAQAKAAGKGVQACLFGGVRLAAAGRPGVTKGPRACRRGRMPFGGERTETIGLVMLMGLVMQMGTDVLLSVVVCGGGGGVGSAGWGSR